MANQTLAEQEVHFNISADDPNTVYAFSDYPKWQRKLERVGAVLVKEEVGGGRHYTLPTSQLSLRNKKKPMPDAEKARRAERMRSLRAAQ